VTKDLALPDGNVKAYAYFDVVHAWLRRPLSRKELTWVNDGQVGTPIFGYPFKIQRCGRQRLILKQPSEECLRFFARRDDVTGNYVEFAIDIITPFAWQLKQATKVGFLQRWHRTKQSRIFANDNFRTADLGHPGLSFQAYDDEESKVTGEFPCFHFEAKVSGVRALRQLGVNTISDLFAFDHARFWQRYFVMVEIDMEKLGRFHANRRDGTKRRCTSDADAEVGQSLWLEYGLVPGCTTRHCTVQQFLKAYAKAVGTPSYVIACKTSHSRTADLLHEYGVLPEPDLSLLKPEFRYPLRGAEP
jgi:hypothetical protein